MHAGYWALGLHLEGGKSFIKAALQQEREPPDRILKALLSLSANINPDEGALRLATLPVHLHSTAVSESYF